MQLHPQAAASGVRLLAYDTIASTNLECLARARAGDPGPLWITARSQTAGRGRRGRRFVSEPGNLYASLLLADAAPSSRAAQLSFVAAVALKDAVATAASTVLPRLAVKWPNDVLYDGKKFAGILVEGEALPGGTLATVVGIGVNCAHHPDATSYPATDLLTAGARVSPSTLFRELSAAMLRRLRQWDRGRGFAAIRRAWLAHAFGLGQPLRVALPGRQLEGHFLDLDEGGQLRLRLADGSLEVIAAGDVFPLFWPHGATSVIAGAFPPHKDGRT